MKQAVFAIALAACATDPRVVVPVIDLPSDDADATATGLLDLMLTVAHAGDDRDLVSHIFDHGVDVELPGVPFGDDLVIHMTGFGGGGPDAYGRTCSFGVSSNLAVPSPHLFFSRTTKFADHQALDASDQEVSPLVRVGGLGVSYQGGALLLNGNGLSTIDGVPAEVPLAVGERYDPATNRLVQFGPLAQRTGGAQALLGGSKIVLIGGLGVPTIEVTDGQTIDSYAFPGTPRVGLTATALTDGQVLVVGGSSAGIASSELYEIDPSDSLVIVRRLDHELTRARQLHTATRLGDDLGAPVLIAGGIGSDGVPIADAEMFEPLHAGLPVTFSARMTTPRYQHIAARLPDGSVLFIGGVDKLGQPVFALEQFTLGGGFVDVLNSLPMDAGVIDAAAVTLPDGRILLTGGRTSVGGTPVNTAYILRLDPVDGMIDVISTDHMTAARAGHQMAVLCDGTVWISGGNNTVTVERYNPPPTGRR